MEKSVLRFLLHLAILLFTLQEFSPDVFTTQTPKQTRSPIAFTTPNITSTAKIYNPKLQYLVSPDQSYYVVKNIQSNTGASLVIGSSVSANDSGASVLAQIFGLFAIAAVFPVLVGFAVWAYVARLRAEKDNGKVAKF